MEVHPDFSEFLASLNATGVKYLVVGAYALAFHGAPRNTLDIDVYIQPTVRNADRFLVALEAFGFGSLKVRRNALTEPDRILQLGGHQFGRRDDVNQRGYLDGRLARTGTGTIW